MKTILLSFDYELFFGVHSGTVKKTLIDPTYMLLDAMESEGFRGNFFVDYLMIVYLRKENTQRTLSDLDEIEKQLINMIQRGHRVELHLHPHWIDAKYNGDGTWNFDDFSHYSLKNLSPENIIKLFIEGSSYINGLAQKVQPNYKVCAFRAGGWAVQPFNMLRDAFIKAGISIDSSTGYGCFKFSKDSSFDFRNMPKKHLYRFSNDVCVEDTNGEFIEIPITTHVWSLFDKIEYKILQMVKGNYNNRLTDGTHVRYNGASPSIFCRLKMLLPSPSPIMYSLSMNNPKVLKRNIVQSREEFFCFIDHPKDFTAATCDCIHVLGGGLCKSINYNEFNLI